MDLHPLPHQPHLPGRQGASDGVARRDVDDGFVISSTRMEVRRAVISDVHVDDDAVEGGQPRHSLNYRWAATWLEERMMPARAQPLPRAK